MLHARFTDRRLKEEGSGGFAFGDKMASRKGISSSMDGSRGTLESATGLRQPWEGDSPGPRGEGVERALAVWSRDAAQNLLAEVKEWKRASTASQPPERLGPGVDAYSTKGRSRPAGGGSFPSMSPTCRAKQDQYVAYHDEPQSVTDIRAYIQSHQSAIALVGERTRAPPRVPRMLKASRVKHQSIECVGVASPLPESPTSRVDRLEPLDAQATSSASAARKLEEERSVHLMQLRRMLQVGNGSPIAIQAEPAATLASVNWSSKPDVAAPHTPPDHPLTHLCCTLECDAHGQPLCDPFPSPPLHATPLNGRPP